MTNKSVQINRKQLKLKERDKFDLIAPNFPSSLMSGLSAMDTKASGRLGVLTITYYLWTTFIAVIVGIVLVLIIHPGTGQEKDGHHGSTGPVMTSADALLDLIRSA